MRSSSRREAAISRVVDAGDLHEAFHVTPTDAERQYREKIIAVAGRIDYIGKTDAGELYLALLHGRVVCAFERDQANSLAKSYEGMIVLVTGKCRGLIGDVVVLANCQVH